MPLGPAGSVPSDSRTAALASLADAADSLSKAAAILAAAARAATEAFSTQTPVAARNHENQGINIGKGPDDIRHTELVDMEGANQPSDFGATGGDSHNMANPENKPSPPSTSNDSSKRDLGPLNQPYRLLVDNEADVLLFVCALIDNIVGVTEPWPKDGASFRASVSILRPLYEVMLTEISLEMKTVVYQDWIQFHAIHGPRHVKIWTSSIVVENANNYLRNVWQWSGPHTGDDIPLPEVSPRFVTQNELQSAVEEGALRVETDSDSDIPPPGLSPRPPVVLEQNEFRLTTGHTYFVLDEEFDAIPLMCFISGKYRKLICLLEGHGALRHYQRLFAKITGRLVISPTGANANTGVDEAASQFLFALQPAILLLAYTTTNLPSTLK
ncbi:unnamed protein product, partial [Rhizoctonia solani]